MSQYDRISPCTLWSSVEINANSAGLLSLFSTPQVSPATSDLRWTNMREGGRTSFFLSVHEVAWEIFDKETEGDLEELAKAYADIREPQREHSQAMIAYSGILVWDLLQAQIEIALATAHLKYDPYGNVSGSATFHSPMLLPNNTFFNIRFLTCKLPSWLKPCILRVTLFGTATVQDSAYI